MNVVDSSAWLEYFAGGVNAVFFAEPIQLVDELIVPSIVIYEVFKRFFQQRGESAALEVAASLKRGQVVDFDGMLALSAATISLDLKLPLADSIILATARQFQAVLWTQDEHFINIAGVKYKAKPV
jgi:toxin FitB